MRLFLLRFHLIVGLVVGLVLLLIGGTGFLLALEPRVTAYVGRHVTTVAYSASGSEREEKRLPLNALAAKAEEALGRAPNSVLVKNDPAAAVAFGQGREKTVWLDPYTGALLGETPPGPRKFFRTVEDLHRWLALEGKGRDIGRKVVLAAVCGYLLLLVSGLFMWDRRFNRERNGARRLHKQAGFLLFPLLFVSIVTGLIISINGLANPGGGRGERGMGGGGHGHEGDAPLDYDAFLAKAVAHNPGWKQVSLQIQRGRGAVTANIEEKGALLSHSAGRLTFSTDPASAEEPKWEAFDDQPAAKRTAYLAMAIHRGLYAGWVGTAVTLLVGLATMTLVITGFLLAWKRLFPRRIAPSV